MLLIMRAGKKFGKKSILKIKVKSAFFLQDVPQKTYMLQA